MDLTADSLIKSLLAVLLMGFLAGLALLVSSFDEPRRFGEARGETYGQSACALNVAFCPRR